MTSTAIPATPVRSLDDRVAPPATRSPLGVVTNTSSLPQTRWATLAIPFGTGPKSQYATFGQGNLAVRGPAVGEQSQLWDVYCTLAGKQTVQLNGFREMPNVTDADMPVFKWSDWINGPKLIAKVHVEVGGQRFSFDVDQLATEFLSGARIKVAAFGMRGGFHARFWANLWSNQDPIDIRGGVFWSDPSSPYGRVRCKIWVEWGEPWQPYLASASGFVQEAPGLWLLHDGEILDGDGVPFTGVILPTDKTPGTIEGWREQQELAAREGPITAACSEVLGSMPAPWDDRWMGGLKAPWYMRDRDDGRRAGEALQVQRGNVFDKRPLANDWETGRTGSQPCFGATKDLLATSGDAWRLFELMWSADDYLMRGLIRFEANGRRVTAANHPKWMTWSGYTHDSSTDTLGKDVKNRPWGWDSYPNGRKIGVDDQHRGDLYIQCRYALTGDPLLREQLLHHLQTDKARAFRANRLALPDPTSPTDGNWLDAPRAYGRLWQSWANSLILLPDQRELIVEMAMTELSFWQRQLDDRPVSWISQTIADTVIPGTVASMPWMEALYALGALAMSRALARIGRQNESQAFLDAAKKVSRTCLEYGTLIGQDGLAYVINGVAVRGDNGPQPEEYYRYPRAKAVLQPTPGSDMMVGTPGWILWWAGVIRTGLDHLDGKAKARAQMLWDQAMAGGLDLSAAEWMAI